jgi:hypothetical protein
MRKRLEKGKRKGIPALVGRGGDLGLPRRSARARGRRPSCGPSRGDGAGTRGADAVAAGPHVSESGGGERRHGSTVRANRPPAGEETRPPVARFLDNGEVP